MSESNGNHDEKDKSVSAKVQEARQLYASQKYTECSEVLNDCLSDAASEKGRPYLAELHLMLAKCYRGLDNLKDAIVSCNSALEQRPGWKDPFLVRSACFQVSMIRKYYKTYIDGRLIDFHKNSGIQKP